MAKIAGEIEASDGGLDMSVTYERFVHIDARLPVQPPGWIPAALILQSPRYRIQAWRQITLSAATESIEVINGWPATDGTNSVTGAKVAAWEEYDDGVHPSMPIGAALSSTSFSAADDEPRHATHAVSGHPAYLTYQIEGGGETGELLALYFEFENDLDFDESDPSSVRNYETIGRNTGTWAPYAANRSCSAWLMQRILAQNLNKILYQTKQCWTVPV